MENEDINAEDIQDDVFSADIDDEDYLDDFAEEKEEPEKEPEKEEPAEDEPDENDKRISDLEKQIERLEKSNAQLGYALRKAEPKDKKEEKETPFSKADLMKIYKEHYDDPDVVFQVMEELTKQGKVDAQAAAEKSADIKNKKTEMDSFIGQHFPSAKEEGSDLHNGIQEAIEWAHLDGHPFAEQLGFAILMTKNLPETINKVKEEVRKEYDKTYKKELEDKAETARKGAINKNKPSKTGNTSHDIKSTSLTPSQLDTAKRMGFKTKEQLARYAKIVGKKGETIHAEG